MSKREEVLNKALPMLNSGMSVLQISKEITDVSYATLKRYLGEIAPKKPRLTDEDKATAIRMFDEGYTTVDIANALSRDNSNIGDFLKSRGRQPRNRKSGLLNADEKKICDLYTDKLMSTESIGEQFSVSERTVAKVLVDNGIELRSRGVIPKIVNHDYFEFIDVEEKAYFLGLLIADGGIIKSYDRENRNLAVSIELDQEDGYMVEMFEQVLCNSIGTTKPDGRGCVAFRGSSKKLTDDLAKYGVVTRKSPLTYLPTVSEELMPHLIRGIFDGDGTVFKAKKRSGVTFGFYGTERICNEIKEYLIEKIGVSDNKVFNKTDCNVSFVYFSKKADVQNFYHLIYDNATIYLTRKKDVFINHANAEVIVEGKTSTTP